MQWLMPFLLLFFVQGAEAQECTDPSLPNSAIYCEVPGSEGEFGTSCGNTTITGGSVFLANSSFPLFLRGQRTDNWAYFSRTSSQSGGTDFLLDFTGTSATGSDPASPTRSSTTITLNRDGNYFFCFTVQTGNQLSGQTYEAYLDLSNTAISGVTNTRVRQTSAVNTGQVVTGCNVLPAQNSGDTIQVRFRQTGTNSICNSANDRCYIYIRLLAGSGE